MSHEPPTCNVQLGTGQCQKDRIGFENANSLELAERIHRPVRLALIDRSAALHKTHQDFTVVN